MRLILATAMIALACTPGAARDSTPPAMTEAEAAATKQAAERGMLMYAYDQAAWHGIDDLRAKTDIAKLGTGGWIVDGPVQAPQLVFFDKDAAAPHALYVADFRDGRLVASHLTVPGPDTGRNR